MKRVPCTQFLPVVTPYITVVQYQNQEIDIGTICRAYLLNRFHQWYRHLFMCMCVALYNLFTKIALCKHYIIKILNCTDVTRFLHPFIVIHCHPLSPPKLLEDINPFFISKIMLLHKCYIDRIMQYASFGDWLFSFSIISLSHPNCCKYQ